MAGHFGSNLATSSSAVAHGDTLAVGGLADQRSPLKDIFSTLVPSPSTQPKVRYSPSEEMKGGSHILVALHTWMHLCA
jgi:hypothetical protein